ncbi:hypothetical protein TRAPUB_7981 [Trametes pubescens]|uniref:Uncharacterized protein n=1 Tax=Trametes pubescens TaxID=154538 RepID=A0A1M2V1Y4_TRAPU|nr:hypothetical protein TRAPUB_7981 [Trametes pubescens]
MTTKRHWLSRMCPGVVSPNIAKPLLIWCTRRKGCWLGEMKYVTAVHQNTAIRGPPTTIGNFATPMWHARSDPIVRDQYCAKSDRCGMDMTTGRPLLSMDHDLRGMAPPSFVVPASSGPTLGSSISAAIHGRTTGLNPRLPLPSAAFGLADLGPVANSPNVVSSVATGAVQHQDALLRQVCRNIRYKVGTCRPKLPDGVKTPKITEPEKYKGQNDHKMFYSWLDGYLSWLCNYNLGGDKTDNDRLQLTRLFLAGEAEEWFTHKIDYPKVEY